MDQIWWERVPNALAFAEGIIDSLVAEKSVLIQHHNFLPWQDTFKRTVVNRVKQQNASKTFVTISNEVAPGAYLLNECCKAEVRAQYRPSKSYASFLAETNDIVLHNRYFWVTLQNSEELEAWLDFVSEYVRVRNKKAEEPAVFILDWTGKTITTKKKGVMQFSFDNYIGDYDRNVFAMLASSEIKENALIKSYLAELVSNVVGNDIELYAECVHRYKEFLCSPYETVMNCADISCKCDGSPFLFQKSSDQVEHDIWLTQIKTVYPVLEAFRGQFSQKHRSAIQKLLPFSSSYGEVYRDPNDVELGTLVFMAEKGSLLLSKTEYDRLYMFKEARNKLSHLGYLSFSEIQLLYS